jgi:hypothetical protein
MGSIICKNDLAFFDTLEKAYIEKDPVAAAQVVSTLQAFVNKPRTLVKKKIQAMRKQIQAVAVSTDFQILTKDAFNVTVEEDNFDLGYEPAFRQVTLGRGQDTWEIYNVVNGIHFFKVEEGQRIQVDEISGSLVRAAVDYYGGALGYTDRMIRYRKIPAMLDRAMLFRNKFWSNKADNHYLLLATAGAIAGQTTALQGAAADGSLRRNVKTINKAAFDLTDRLKDKGYGDMATAPLLMYANPFDEDAIEAAFRITTNAQGGAANSGEQITRRRIRRIYTYNSNIVSGSPLLVLPGQKIQKADAMQPTTFTAPKDPLTLNELQAVWAIYGAIVADSEQVQKLTLSL